MYKAILNTRKKPMNNALKVLTLGSLIAFGALSSNIAYADETKVDKQIQSGQYERNFEDRKGHAKKRFKHMARKLALTDTQKQEVRAIMEQAKVERDGHKESMKLYREQMKELVTQTTFDQTKFSALYDSFQPTMKEMALAKAKTRHAIAAVLTDEQKEKMASMEKRGRGKGLFN